MPQNNAIDVLRQLLGFPQGPTKSQTPGQQQFNPLQENGLKTVQKVHKEQITEAMQQGVPAQHILEQLGIPMNGQSQIPQPGVFDNVVKNSPLPDQPKKNYGQRFLENFNAQTGLTGAKLDNQLKEQQILNLKSAGNPEGAIERGSQLNQIIDEKMPGYQVTQTADGNWVVHPKPSGMLAQIDPQQMDQISEGLLSGQVSPSQLPRNQKNQVLAAALAKDPSYNPAKADIDFAVNKVGAGNFEKLYNNVTSFEKTFRKNADVALSVSKNFPRSKIPLLNQAIIAKKKHIDGDPQASRMLAALNTVATEYARLTTSPGATGSVLSDAARHEAQNLLNSWMNEGQLEGLLNPETGIMSIDAKNRVDALNETKDEIKSRYDGRGEVSSSEKGMSDDNAYQEYLKMRGN